MKYEADDPEKRVFDLKEWDPNAGVQDKGSSAERRLSTQEANHFFRLSLARFPIDPYSLLQNFFVVFGCFRLLGR